MENKFQLQQICINTTNRCNNRCVYCFTQPNPTDMTFEMAKKTVQFLIDNAPEKSSQKSVKGRKVKNRVFINWFGGEPMLKFEDVIKPTMLWAEEQGYDIGWGISTNAELLTPEALKFFAHFNTGILFSIDGIERVQNEQRPTAGGEPTWPLLEKNLKLFGQYGRGSIFRSTILAKNVDTIVDGYLTARKYGFPNYYPGLVYEDPEWTQEKLDIFLEQIFSICSIMYQDYKDTGHCTLIPPLFSMIREKFTQNKVNYSERRCGLGTNTAGISPEGLIFGCQEHSTLDGNNDIFCIGDIEHGIDEEKRDNLLKTYKAAFDQYYNTEKCLNCRFRESCFISNCPSVTLRATGQMGGIFDSFCNWKDTWDKCATLILAITNFEKNEKFLKLIETQCLTREVLE